MKIQTKDFSMPVVDARQPMGLGWSTKLTGGHSPYALDVDFGDQGPAVNEKEMSVIFPFASGVRRDSVGDLLEIGGIDTSRHFKNPVVLFDHGKTNPTPIALAETPDTRQYTVVKDEVGKVATCKAFFYQSHKDIEHARFCEQVFDMVSKRYIRAGSLGYVTTQGYPLAGDPTKGIPQGMHLQKVLLLEASIVIMPANQDTILKMLSLHRVCGKPMSHVLVKSLMATGVKRKAQLFIGGKAADLPPMDPEKLAPSGRISQAQAQRMAREKRPQGTGHPSNYLEANQGVAVYGRNINELENPQHYTDNWEDAQREYDTRRDAETVEGEVDNRDEKAIRKERPLIREARQLLGRQISRQSDEGRNPSSPSTPEEIEEQQELMERAGPGIGTQEELSDVRRSMREKFPHHEQHIPLPDPQTKARPEEKSHSGWHRPGDHVVVHLGEDHSAIGRIHPAGVRDDGLTVTYQDISGFTRTDHLPHERIGANLSRMQEADIMEGLGASPHQLARTRLEAPAPDVPPAGDNSDPPTIPGGGPKKSLLELRKKYLGKSSGRPVKIDSVNKKPSRFPGWDSVGTDTPGGHPNWDDEDDIVIADIGEPEEGVNVLKEEKAGGDYIRSEKVPPVAVPQVNVEEARQQHQTNEQRLQELREKVSGKKSLSKLRMKYLGKADPRKYRHEHPAVMTPEMLTEHGLYNSAAGEHDPWAELIGIAGDVFDELPVADEEEQT